MIQPETIILAGAGLWIAGALVTGIPNKRFPSMFPFFFAVIGVIGSLVGITEMVPERIDILLTLIAAILYIVAPIVFAAYLYYIYPSQDKPRQNRTLH